MKKSKFKGRRVDNNQIVFGNLLEFESSSSFGEEGVFSNLFIVEFKDLDMRAFRSGCEVWMNNGVIQVIPETVKQFTGRFDKNNSEIYEGDRVLLGGSTVFVVELVNGSFSFKNSDTYILPIDLPKTGEIEIIK